MKNILFTSAAAICSAIGMTYFKDPVPTDLRLTYYFYIHIGKSYQTTFNNADVNYLGTTPGLDAGSCPGSGKRCVVGFTPYQISKVGGITKLKTGNNPPQTRVITVFTRSTI